MMEPRKVKGGPNGVGELTWWMEEVGRLVDDAAALRQALELQAHLDRVIRAAARRIHDKDGVSWYAIGAELGVSDVAARKRFLAEGGRRGGQDSVGRGPRPS